MSLPTLWDKNLDQLLNVVTGLQEEELSRSLALRPGYIIGVFLRAELWSHIISSRIRQSVVFNEFLEC